MTDLFRIHDLALRTRVLGPGERTAIWFQGCKRSCPGCMSASSRPLDGGKQASVTRLAQLILAQEGIEGITVSGGEPFLQAEALYALVEQLRRNSQLGIIVYTGYTLEQLWQLQDPWVDGLLDGRIDLLIDGEYVEALNDGKSLRGSSNQQLHFLTGRYLPYAAMYEENRRNAEVRIRGNDAFFIGIPARETWEHWRSALSALNGDKPE